VAPSKPSITSHQYTPVRQTAHISTGHKPTRTARCQGKKTPPQSGTCGTSQGWRHRIISFSFPLQESLHPLRFISYLQRNCPCICGTTHESSRIFGLTPSIPLSSRAREGDLRPFLPLSILNGEGPGVRPAEKSTRLTHLRPSFWDDLCFPLQESLHPLRLCGSLLFSGKGDHSEYTVPSRRI